LYNDKKVYYVRGGVDTMFTLWLTISIITLLLDIITSSFLFVWFTIGGMAALIAMTLNCSANVQWIVFILVSVVFMAVGYPLVKRTIKKTVPRTATMEEGYIGRELTVDEDVIEKAMVKIDGIYWTIKNQGTPIKKGDRVKISGIEGNKMLVEKI
jgi:membrane protein implicated in regulation of membrane protease activity